MRKPCLLLFLFPLYISAQTKLQPGFDAKEYTELLSLAFHSNSIADSSDRTKKRDPYHMAYRSPEVGLYNRWTLYIRDDNVAVIDVRGTVNQAPSWLENFYSAMIPATGSLQINDSTRFDYSLAKDARATVHVGWTLGLAHLAPMIEEKINEIYRQKNITQVLMFGHSQGGALITLLRSWLEYEKEKGRLSPVVLKTYCSASPKVGNLYYAYDFDFITRGGWALTVVNAADWVPETPFTIQSLNDLNPANPFAHVKKILKKQKFFARLALGIVYNKLDRKSRKAQKKFERYLGSKVYRQVKKILPQFKEPEYVPVANYMRAGTPIVLMPDEDYFKHYNDNSQIFIHHSFSAYYFLVKKYYPF
jgi:predicted lipase